MAEEIKRCTECDEDLPVSAFGWRADRGGDGTPRYRRASKCRGCRARIARERSVGTYVAKKPATLLAGVLSTLEGKATPVTSQELADAMHEDGTWRDDRRANGNPLPDHKKVARALSRERRRESSRVRMVGLGLYLPASAGVRDVEYDYALPGPPRKRSRDEQLPTMVCGSCRRELPLAEFRLRRKGGKEYHESPCLECISEAKKQMYAANPEPYKQRARKSRLADPEGHRQRGRTYYREHRKERREYGRKHREANPEKYAEYARTAARNRRSTPKGRLNDSMSSGIAASLRNGKGGVHWEEFVPWTLDELMAHLEGLFEPGMCWENRGVYRKGGPPRWHMDHVIPLAAFGAYESAEDAGFQAAWALSNLVPRWGQANISKGSEHDGARWRKGKAYSVADGSIVAEHDRYMPRKKAGRRTA